MSSCMRLDLIELRAAVYTNTADAAQTDGRAGCALAQPGNPLVAQLPADDEPGDAAMLHYTWGTIFKDAAGGKVWEFDKRAYTDEKFQRIVRAPALLHSVLPPPGGACLCCLHAPALCTVLPSLPC